jgi:hypothetical protein
MCNLSRAPESLALAVTSAFLLQQEPILVAMLTSVLAWVLANCFLAAVLLPGLKVAQLR